MANIIITGNPVDGFNHYGPFPKEVTDFSDDLEGVDDEYWVAQLQPPSELDDGLTCYDPPANKTATCKHCGRSVTLVGSQWINPEATGDDSLWRETCEALETFPAEHEPDTAPDADAWVARPIPEQQPLVDRFDALCDEILPKVLVQAAFDAMVTYTDSFDREVLFQRACDRFGLSYDALYDTWLAGKTTDEAPNWKPA